jgi:hypothetical protein
VSKGRPTPPFCDVAFHGKATCHNDKLRPSVPEGLLRRTCGVLVAGHTNYKSTPFRAACYDKGFADRLLDIIVKSGKPLATWTHERIAQAMAPQRPPGSPRPLTDAALCPNAAFRLLATVPDYAAFLPRLLTPRGTAPDLKRATRAALMQPHAWVKSALSWDLGWIVLDEQGFGGSNGKPGRMLAPRLPLATGSPILVVRSRSLQFTPSPSATSCRDGISCVGPDSASAA